MGIDVTWDQEGPAKDFVKQYNLPYLVGRDSSGWIGSKYGVEATPNTFFIGRDGTLVEHVEGELDQAGFEQRFEKLLAG